MLSNDDLSAIGSLIEEKLESKLEEKLESKLEEKLESKLGTVRADIHALEGRMDARLTDLEERMNVKFDALHEQIEGVENRVVTKAYLDEKLAYYVRRVA